MDTTTPVQTGFSKPDALSPSFPWLALVILGAATFTLVTAEMLPAALLPQMSAGLAVSESQIGMLVSLWAAAVVIGSFPLVRLTRRFDRRVVIVGALAALAASAALTGLLPTYPGVVAARLVGALAVGLLWATTNALTADLVADRDLARAVAVVLGGATLGMVLGLPAGSIVAQAVGWRAAFGGLAALALLVAVLVRVVVRPPSATTSEATGTSDAAADPDPPARRLAGLGPLLTVTLLVALLLVGHYGAYTFITRLAESPAAALPGGMATMLFVFGVASAVGIALAGRFGARTARALLVSSLITGSSLLALSIAGAHPAVGTAVVVVWAVASGALPALAQTLILRLAGTARRSFAGALIPVLFNLGIAVGAALAAVTVGTAGLTSLSVLSAAIVGMAVIGLALTIRRLDLTRTGGSAGFRRPEV